MSPERLLRRLALSAGMRVVEIGPGGGYYARPLSGAVRSLIAVDVQAAMLKRLQRKPRANLLPLRADAMQLPLATRSIDAVVAVTALGEIPSPEAAIAEVRRVLRPGGFFSVSEHWPDPDFIPFARLSDLCRTGGLHLDTHYGGRRNYTATFRTDAV